MPNKERRVMQAPHFAMTPIVTEDGCARIWDDATTWAGLVVFSTA